MNRLEQKYKEVVTPSLMKKFNYKSVMEVPHVDKIVINMGIGEAISNPKVLDEAVAELAQITGQAPVITKAKKSIANFKLREGMPIGCKVTLRKEKMYDFMDKLMNGYVVAAMLILYGVLFIVLENRNVHRHFPIERVTQISFQTAALIGCFQVLAMIPGTSRSGATILGAMLIGCSRPAAAEFSFFLGIPVMFGASFLKIVKFFIQGGGFSFAEFIYLVLGMVVAFGVSVYSIKFLMGYVRKHDFKFFGYYRIVLGIVVLSYFGISALVG